MECVDVQPQSTATPDVVVISVLTDNQLANLLQVTREWVRSHRAEIPGLIELGNYCRFRCADVQEWLGSIEQLWNVPQVAHLMKVPSSWIYANADQVPGVLRLGRYIRFRPSILKPFIGMSETCQ